jgi:adenylylsulfate kinase
VVWITGRPGAGKSTLGRSVAARLRDAGVACALLDGDEVRGALARPAGQGPAERDAFYMALAQLAALLACQGLVVVVPATANRRAHREAARALAPRFVEVHVATSGEECERRDPKGLYARVRAGTAARLPGADDPYEDPIAADVTASGGEDARAALAIVAAVLAPPPERRA